jgi:hypothetical protein
MSLEKIIRLAYSGRYIRPLLHIAFWVGLYGVQQYITNISFNNYKHFPDHIVSLLNLTGTIRIALFYYPFVYWVLPRFFYKKRFITGMLMTLLLIIIFAFTDTLVEEFVLKSCTSCMSSLKAGDTGYSPFLQMSLVNRLILKLMSMGMIIGVFFNIALPLSIKLGIQALRSQLRAMQLAKENLQLELNFLKSQVNPHFLFNTLNNIYGLILKNEKEKSASMVARLSQFLRYSLYESDSYKVPVDKELQLLKDYIELESVRLNRISVKFTHQSDGSVTTIAPLLMIPLIENSFKYTTDKTGAYIAIDFRIANKMLCFTLQNSFDPERQSGDIGGIGLNNFNKRLDLYYPGKYTYQVTKSEEQYAVTIIIDCHE